MDRVSNDNTHPQTGIYIHHHHFGALWNSGFITVEHDCTCTQGRIEKEIKGISHTTALKSITPVHKAVHTQQETGEEEEEGDEEHQTFK